LHRAYDLISRGFHTLAQDSALGFDGQLVQCGVNLVNA
jgi:hypothetical protein